MSKTTKQCTKCGIIKQLSEFYKRKDRPLGVTSWCKKCELTRCEDYQKTEDGVISTIFSSQKQSSKHRGHPLPLYNKRELREWVLLKNEFYILYDKWVKSGYKKMMKPSIDRIDDYLPYTFNNIQLSTWGINKDKYHKDAVSGANTKQCKCVIQLSVSGETIARHFSLASAEKKTGVYRNNISKVCSGERNKAGGFKWMFG